MTYVPSGVPSNFLSGVSSDSNNNNSNNNSNYNNYSSTTSSYTPSSSTGGYVPSAAGAGGIFSTSSSYTPAATAATTSSKAPYVPSAAASHFSATPSSSYTPSVPAAVNPSYTPSHPVASTRQGNAYGSSGSSGGYTSTSAYKPVMASPVGGAHGYAVGSGPTNGVMTQQGNPTKCHKLDYEIKGNDMQLVECVLDPQETCIAEAGEMMYLEDDITFEAKFGDGSDPNQGFFGKLMAAGGRLLTGESLFLTHFTNQGSQQRRVAFAAPYPGTIIPVDMSASEVAGTIICQKDAFLCAAFGTKLEIHFNRRIGSGLFGGEGFILQKLTGDGMAFIHAGGCCIKRELNNERLRVDTGCLVAFTSGIKYDITMVKGLVSMFFGGEGLFLATLEGTGTVWLQSLPFSRMADRIVQAAPSIGGRRQGEGSALTGKWGDMIDGDGFSKW